MYFESHFEDLIYEKKERWLACTTTFDRDVEKHILCFTYVRSLQLFANLAIRLDDIIRKFSFSLAKCELRMENATPGHSDRHGDGYRSH